MGVSINGATPSHPFLIEIFPCKPSNYYPSNGNHYIFYTVDGCEIRITSWKCWSDFVWFSTSFNHPFGEPRPSRPSAPNFTEEIRWFRSIQWEVHGKLSSNYPKWWKKLKTCETCNKLRCCSIWSNLKGLTIRLLFPTKLMAGSLGT